MKWIIGKLVKAIRNYNDEQNKIGKDSCEVAISSTGHLDSNPAMTFTIYNAVGGKVVEFRRYDRKTDRSDHCVYVVGSEEDFGNSIARIATMEALKN